MSWREIPLSPVPFQTVSAVVNGQKYTVTVRQMGGFLYTSVSVDGTPVVSNLLAVENGRVIPFAQPVAKTMLYWIDTKGRSHPHYTGLGDRWLLVFEETDG